MAVTLAILILLFGLVVVLPEFPRYIIFIIFILYAIFFVVIRDISIMTMWRMKRWSITIGTIFSGKMPGHDGRSVNGIIILFEGVI